MRHLDVYPGIRPVRDIQVPTTTIDELLSREPYRDQRFNFINIDVQGAELLALAGATATLAAVEIIDAEVNFDELYAGGAHIRELDDFLWARGFIRVDTACQHAAWGNAIYVRTGLAKARRG